MNSKFHLGTGKSRAAAVLLLTLVALGLRIPGAGSFMTADEENWMVRSSQYYHNLFRKYDTGGAFMTTHPGATAMWLIGGGLAIQEQRVGFDVDTSNLTHFRRAATWPMALATSLLIGVIVWQLWGLVGRTPTIIAGILLAADPYLTGLSQIAHLDALLALLMLPSFLFMLRWQKESMRNQLIWAGIFAGLAMGTKLLPALWLFVMFGGLAGYGYLRKQYSFHNLVRSSFFVFGVAMLAFYAVWPALWRTADLGRSFEKDVPTIVADSHIEFEQSQEPINPKSFYVRAVAGRTPPLVLLVAVAALGLAGVQAVRTRRVSDIAWLGLFTIGFLILISFAAKKGDRYAEPALAALPIIAGLGLAGLIHLVKENRRRLTHIAVGVILLVSVAGAIMWSPYTIAYTSPVFPDVRPLSQQGWGEGLDEAAVWLNQHPLADQIHVASWYPSVLATYFKGKTMSLSSRNDRRVVYIVAYRNMGGRAGDDIASNVLDELKGQTPEHVISIRGVPYVWIYATDSLGYFSRHFGEITGSVQVGQTVPIAENGWSQIDIGMANFSGRQNTRDVLLEVYEDIDAATPIRTVVVNAAQIGNESWHTFTFDPIEDSAGQTYYISIRSPQSVSGDAITVRYIDVDVAPGDMVFFREALRPGQARSQFIRPGDIAYRVPAATQPGQL